MSAILFLALRASHVLLAATWIGSGIFVSTQLMPALEASGAAGGQIMMRINHRVTTYMAMLASATLVTGLYLLWHFAGAFSEIGATHAGIAFAVGGAAGILSGVIGAGVVGRGAHRLSTLMEQAAGAIDGPAKAELMQLVASVRQRVKVGSRTVLLLQMLALVLMAVGHYI